MSYKGCTTDRLRELIRMDPISEAYRATDRFAELDPHGQHLLTLDKAFVSVNQASGISVHRIEVNAKMRKTLKPWRFTLEIPVIHWEKLRDITPVDRGAS